MAGSNDRYPYPAIVALDPLREYWLKLSCGIARHLFLWAEGPVYFGDGRYLLCSDVPGDRNPEVLGGDGAVKRPTASPPASPNGRHPTTARGASSLRSLRAPVSRGILRHHHDPDGQLRGQRLNRQRCRRESAARSVHRPPFGLSSSTRWPQFRPEIDTNVDRLSRYAKATIVAEGVLVPTVCASRRTRKISRRGTAACGTEDPASDMTDGGTKLARKRVRIDADRVHHTACAADVGWHPWFEGHGSPYLDCVMVRRRTQADRPHRAADVAHVSRSAGRSATACSWRRANRSTPCTSTRRAHSAAEAQLRRSSETLARSCHPCRGQHP